MSFIKIIPLLLFSIAVFTSCKNSNPQNRATYKQDSIKVFSYLIRGDEQYAKKASLLNFYKSLELYDTALQIAKNNGDTFLVAASIYAKGRAYDAINNNPQKTIDYFTQAANLYATLPHKKKTYLFIKQLLAHSYDKVKDSVNCVAVLKQLYSEIAALPDSVKRKINYISEMALISTEVKNYTLADSLLQYLTKRDDIKNDSSSYDYLNHYYLTQARIAVYQHNNLLTPYLDSLEMVYATCKNLSDSVYYSKQLTDLFATTKNKVKENYYLHLNAANYSKFNVPNTVREIQDKLDKAEIAAIEQQRKTQQQIANTRTLTIYILSALLLAIIILLVFLNRKNSQTKAANILLHQKNIQNEILNKEIHHRVKNNLEMIMSLVYMQQRNSNTKEVKENMQSISLRIESIANLHQQLMEQTDKVDLKKYIQHLVANVSNLLGDNKKIITNLEIQQLEVPQKISFPLGLIINEWITNSIKYAQPIADPLTLFIEIKNGNKHIKVTYFDNGIAQNTLPQKKSLGLDIVNLFVAQLNATLQTNTDNIFTYQLIIPLYSDE